MNTTAAAVTPAQLPIPKVTLEDGQAMASSVDVAEYFGKQHRNVIQAIELMDVPENLRALNFQQTETTRPNPLPNRAPIKSKSYLMTKKWFTLLAMGFTGKKAMQFKLAYIETFEALEELVRLEAAQIAEEEMQRRYLGCQTEKERAVMDKLLRQQRFTLWLDFNGKIKLEEMAMDEFVTSMKNLANCIDEATLNDETARSLVSASVAITGRLYRYYRGKDEALKNMTGKAVTPSTSK